MAEDHQPVTQHPLVRAVLRAWPGATIEAVRGPSTPAKPEALPLLRYQSRISRRDLQANPRTLYVFGDNLDRKGFGGQAEQCRGEPNAVGIATKRHPVMYGWAFFTDQDLDEFRAAAAPAFARLAEHLRAGGVVVWPSDGIGTGRAQLDRRAPRLWAALERARLRLEAIGCEERGQVEAELQSA